MMAAAENLRTLLASESGRSSLDDAESRPRPSMRDGSSALVSTRLERVSIEGSCLSMHKLHHQSVELYAGGGFVPYLEVFP